MSTCTCCNDTGSKEKSFYGQLDCVACNVALERTELEDWARQRQVTREFLWEIFRRGREVGRTEAACKK